MVHTCPRCELRFELSAEVADHLVHDHRFDPEALQPHLVPGPKPGRRLVVVVGNHTLLADALRDRLQAVVAGGDVDLHVVVPVRTDDELDIGFWRGRALAERILEPGVELTVDVGIDDPVHLVQKAVRGAHIDQIIVSTLPVGVSRWLHADVAGHLHHTLNVPVEVVNAEGWTAPAPMVGVRLGFAVFGAFWGTWAVATLDIQEFLGLSDIGLGVLVASTVLGTSVANVAGGALAERHGAGRATTAALAIWGSMLFGAAALPWPGAWMALFLAVVAAGGLLDVVLNIASTGALQNRPGPLLRVHASYNLGTIVGAATTGVAVAALGTWRWSMLLVAVAAVALAATLRSGRVTIPPVTSQEHAKLHEAISELRRSGLVPLAVVFALGAMVEGGIGTFGVLYLRDHLDVAVLAGAGAYVVGQALATTTRYALGSEAAGRHLGGTRPARLGLALAAAGLTLEAATDVPAVAALGLAVASIGAATYWPLLCAVATRASERPGLAVGGVSAAGYLGFLAGPPVVGAVAEGATLRAGVLVLAVAGATAASIPLKDLARRLLALA